MLDTKVELFAYSGQRVFGRLREARSEDEIRTHLAEARARGWTVSVRSGQMAFDTHALNEGMTLQLKGFDKLDLIEDLTITVGANASWGKILAATKAKGCVPYVMVSTEYATAGGTLSADCLSRFSPTCGKEGNHVERFRMMKLDGSIVTCSRTQNKDLFAGMISGFGFLGIVLDVTYRLLDVGCTNIVVATTFTPFTGLRDLANALVTEVDSVRSPDDLAPRSVEALQAVKVEDARAMSAVVFMNEKRQGFVMRSHYANGDEVELHPSPFHQPESIIQRALQVLAFFEVTREIGYWLTLNLLMRKRISAVDKLEGFTFFQGGNDAVRRAGRKYGFPMSIRQQTFVLPREEGSAATKDKLATFLERTDTLLDRLKIVPPLIDVLYLPDDADEGFVLSSNHGISGYAVTITFEDPSRTDLEPEEGAFKQIASICHEMGGRVHLVKNVFASADELAAMYGWGVSRMQALKAEHDPERLLSNGFLSRVLPALARP